MTVKLHSKRKPRSRGPQLTRTVGKMGGEKGCLLEIMLCRSVLPFGLGFDVLYFLCYDVF